MLRTIIFLDNNTIGDLKILSCDSKKQGWEHTLWGTWKKIECVNVLGASKGMKTSLNINGECTWLAFCLNYFPIPIPMLHANILACTILKFIKELSYGKDPVHLPCTKIKALILSHLKNCHK